MAGFPLVPSRGHTDLLTELQLREVVNQWLVWDQNETTKDQIKNLWESENDERIPRLKQLLNNRLEFGTAGLRGKMEAGFSRMNDLVIIQTTQGLASYLESLEESDNKSKGVVIGFDGRHNSRRFASLTALVFLLGGFRVYLFSDIVPTPFVPFCVKEKSCAAGIMVTASHNPKDDNGYKVYWDNGAQIVPPHDRHIQAKILQNLEPTNGVWDLSRLDREPNLLNDPMADIMAKYYDILFHGLFDVKINQNFKAKITYSAMHGVGYKFMAKSFEIANFCNLTPVVEQRDPDPDFPTVAFPNPEEGKSALNLSMATADAAGSKLILANDPDADRLAVAEKKSDGGWVIFSGNELGVLLGWWCYYSYKSRNPNVSNSDIYMLGSTVSTKFLQTMANAEGFHYIETLTGFKWMGNKANELVLNGKIVLFAFEEAIGFMCGTAVLDKDGISAGVHAAELAAYLHTKEMTLQEKLQELYVQYGHHMSKNSYFLCYQSSLVCEFFEHLRNFGGKPNTYPTSLGNGKYPIKDIRDLTTGYDSSQPDKKACLPVSSSSQMITFRFENGLVATLRASGTEPKVKYYTELCASPEQSDVKILQSTLQEMVQMIINEFIQPDKYNMENPPE